MEFKTRLGWVGLLAGPLLAIVCYLALPCQYYDSAQSLVEFSSSGRVTLAVMVWMGVWWLTEAIHISATALLPVVLFPLLGATTISAATAPYSHPLVFLVLGGFLIAIALEKWGLDRRIAYSTLKLVGTNPVHMIAGVMFVTALLSAFVSNTATTAMMLPIALSIIDLAGAGHDGSSTSEALAKNFNVALLLGIAYASTIGGIATIIGTGPNAFLVGFVSETIASQYQTEISFLRWLPIGLSVTIVLLPLTWFLLTKVLFPVSDKPIQGGDKLVKEGLARLGPVCQGEKLTFIVFLLAALLWTTRPLLVNIVIPVMDHFEQPFKGLTDCGVAMLSALLLFVIPADIKNRIFLLDWQSAMKLPWGILLLFGGGLSLSEAVQNTGVAEFIGSQARYIAGLPDFVHVFTVTAVVTSMTELTSNVATTASLLPILAALSPGLGINPYILIVAATLASSCAFMMPVATPPNAIVFGSGKIAMVDMIRAGFWLNITGIVLVTLIAYFLVPLVFKAPI